MSLESRVLRGTPADIVNQINTNLDAGGTFFLMTQGPGATFITFEDVIPPVPPVNEFLLLEDAFFILLEDGFKIIL